MDFFKKRLVKSWYKKGDRSFWFLYPLMLLYGFLSLLRKSMYRSFLLSRHYVPVHLIVVGNISIGGTGKTPLVITLVNYLKSKGMNPGVVSRGYGGTADIYPLFVNGQVSPEESGDEPLLIFKRTGVPVVVDPDRVRAAKLLVFEAGCDVVVSDDGLQHLAMGRDFEIVVVDAARGFGNGHLLPLGPLREPVSRLDDVNLVVLNKSKQVTERVKLPASVDASKKSDMLLKAGELVPLQNTPYYLMPVEGDTLHAVAGIGNPERFFATLESLGFTIIRHVFDDHFNYKPADLDFGDELAIVMTEKDAVKCDGFQKENLWYLPVEAELDENFYSAIDQFLKL